MRPRKIHRETDGSLPFYAWPGGYPVLYLMEDGETLCPACANGENGSLAYAGDPPEDPEGGRMWQDPQWHIVAQFVHYEGAPEFCAHCNAETPSAYGDPDSPDSER